MPAVGIFDIFSATSDVARTVLADVLNRGCLTVNYATFLHPERRLSQLFVQLAWM